MYKKGLCFIVTLFLMIAMPATVSAPTCTTFTEGFVDEHLVATYGLEFAQNYSQSFGVREEIWNLFPTNRAGEILFPDYFGGKFIDDNGGIVINIVESAANGRNAMIFNDIIENPIVNTQMVQFSYRELHHTMEMLGDFWENNPENIIRQGMTWWKIDIIGNRIVVGILQDYFESVESLISGSILDSPIIVVERGTPFASRVNRVYR